MRGCAGHRVVIVALLGCSLVRAAEDAAADRSRPRLEPDEPRCAGSAEGFARAIEPREFEFPRDHGPHSDFRTEWWYLTGNLETRGRATLRLPVHASSATRWPRRSPARESAWATSQVYMVHLALTDVEDQPLLRLRAFRARRGRPGRSRDRAISRLARGLELRGRRRSLRLSVCSAENDDVALDIELSAVKPLVLQGDAGLEPQGSQTRATRPTTTRSPASRRQVGIRVGGAELDVTGLELARPGVEHQRSRGRAAGLGLVRAAARRRSRSDGLPDPA